MIGATLFSCSSNDDNPAPPTPEIQLDKFEQKIYNNEVLDRIIVADFNNNRLEKSYSYNAQKVLGGYSNWVNNPDGLLSAVNDFSSEDVLIRKLEITYDNQDRIINTDQVYSSSPTEHKVVTFTHNSDNTIDSERSFLGTVENRVFEVNAEGLIDKELQDGTVVVSVVYDGNNPISKTVSSEVYHYSYHQTGMLPSNVEGFLGNNTNPINYVLYANSLNHGSDNFTRKLITEISTSSFTRETVYILNENNIPLSSKRYKNGALESEIEYFYE